MTDVCMQSKLKEAGHHVMLEQHVVCSDDIPRAVVGTSHKNGSMDQVTMGAYRITECSLYL